MSKVDKFGTDGIQDNEIMPFHDHMMNLDDLENVEGFNDKGIKNKLYGFKLDNRGMYVRDEIKEISDNNIQPVDYGDKFDIPLNIIARRDKEPLFVKANRDWEIDIEIKNNTVYCKGNTNIVQKIINSGTMFGNLVTQFPKHEDGTRVAKLSGKYGITAATNKATVLDFETRFPQDAKMLKRSPCWFYFYFGRTINK